MELTCGSAASAASLRSAANGIATKQCIAAGQVRAIISSFNDRSRRGSVAVSAKIKKGKMGPEEAYPWPEKFPPGEITDGALKYLNRFKPLANPQKLLTLPFERPIVDLENKIDEVSMTISQFCDIGSVFWVFLNGGM